MSLLNETIVDSLPVDFVLEAEIRGNLDNLTQPPGSLGYLEELAVRYCLATGTPKPHMGKKIVFYFAGDHGVVAGGTSAYPKAVTRQMVVNMLVGDAAVNVLALHTGVEVRVVDIGVDTPLQYAEGLLEKRIRKGSANIAEGPAMAVEEAKQAIEVGIDLAVKAEAEGVTLIGTGDMGIGNTTPSSAIFAVLLSCDVKDVTGRGTGIDADTLAQDCSHPTGDCGEQGPSHGSVEGARGAPRVYPELHHTKI